MVPLVPVSNSVPGANYPESNGHNILKGIFLSPSHNKGRGRQPSYSLTQTEKENRSDSIHDFLSLLCHRSGQDSFDTDHL